jgi:hypothetical protein
MNKSVIRPYKCDGKIWMKFVFCCCCPRSGWVGFAFLDFSRSWTFIMMLLKTKKSVNFGRCWQFKRVMLLLLFRVRASPSQYLKCISYHIKIWMKCVGGWYKSSCYTPNLCRVLWSKPTHSKWIITVDLLMFIVDPHVEKIVNL